VLGVLTKLAKLTFNVHFYITNEIFVMQKNTRFSGLRPASLLGVGSKNSL